MALIRCDFASSSLGLSTSLCAIIPEAATAARIPTLYLLHGLSGDCTMWPRCFPIERRAHELGWAVIMPSLARSYCLDMVHGPRYWTFLSEELPAVARRLFPLSDERSQNYVLGLSMGGYGALRLGLTFPERYALVGALSSVTDLQAGVEAVKTGFTALTTDEMIGILGTALEVKDTEIDLFHLCRRMKNPGASPKFFLTCGTEDYMLGDSRRFHRAATDAKLDITYVEGKGAHDWCFWDGAADRAITWMAENARRELF